MFLFFFFLFFSIISKFWWPISGRRWKWDEMVKMKVKATHAMLEPHVLLSYHRYPVLEEVGVVVEGVVVRVRLLTLGYLNCTTRYRHCRLCWVSRRTVLNRGALNPSYRRTKRQQVQRCPDGRYMKLGSCRWWVPIKQSTMTLQLFISPLKISSRYFKKYGGKSIWKYISKLHSLERD